MEIKPKRIIPSAVNLEGSTRRWAEKLVTFLDKLIKDISKIPFNRSEEISYTTNASADTEDTVSHHLGYKPTGFILVNQNKAGILYDSGTTWTENNIYLKCDVISNDVTIRIF